MEVSDFASSIHAFAQICQESFKVQGGKGNLSVKISSDVKKGSFGTTLFVLGLIAATRLALKAFHNIKGVQGRKLLHVREGGVSYLHDPETNERFKVELFEGILTEKIHPLVKKFTKAIKDGSVETIRVNDDHQCVSFSKPDIEYLEGPSKEEKIENLWEKVKVITPHLDGNPKKWEFESEKHGKFSADVEAEQFTSDVQKGKVSFVSGRILKVKMEIKTIIKENKERKHYKIYEVINEDQHDLL